MAEHNNRVTRWLDRSPAWVLAMFAVTTAFITYFCMYGFRKPYSVAEYAGLELWKLDLKDILIISQLIGYSLSKFGGIKFNSEMPAKRRLVALFTCILLAEAALVLFALVPNELKLAAIFLNGLPLGVVWGLVFSFLEGRRTSEILGAGLSCSYIVASGFVKTIGKSWLDYGVSESWMPAVTGLCFLPMFMLMAYALSLLPPPNQADIDARVVRAPMHKKQRRAFAKRYLGGIILLILVYALLTAYRDFRDNFAPELWKEILGKDTEPAIFTVAELPIAFSVMLALALLYLVKNNRLGLLLTYVIMTAGAVMVGVSTLLLDMGVISGTAWMIVVGLGLYLGYVPFGCVLFDRMIAALGVVATSVFLIYVSDAFAYGTSVGVLLYKTLGPELSYYEFFHFSSYVMSIGSTVLLIVSGIYFMHRTKST